MRIGIIGAGPAGILAALKAAQNGADALLLDSNAQIGRKLLVTGSGRCNLSNAQADGNHYFCSDPQFVEAALKKFGSPQLISLLQEFGIPSYSTPDGWYYPLSNSAGNVVDILEAQLKQWGVTLQLNANVVDIKQSRRGFEIFVRGSKEPICTERLIIATGGKAYPQLGSTGEFYSIIKKLGHTIRRIEPALAPVKTKSAPFHKLQGVRLDVSVMLYEGSKLLTQSTGNMIFTAWGINGPAVMNLSHLISLNTSKKPLTLHLNFLHEHEQKLLEFIAANRRRAYSLRAALEGVLPEKIVSFAMGRARLADQAVLNELSDAQIQRVLEDLKGMVVEVEGTRGFEFCQVTTGGVDLREVDPLTMQSRIVSGLYFAGEVLDVIGPCGGFNLQWAFTSGVLAGSAAANK